MRFAWTTVLIFSFSLSVLLQSQANSILFRPRFSVVFLCFGILCFSGLDLLCWDSLTPRTKFHILRKVSFLTRTLLSSLRSPIQDSKGNQLLCLILDVYIRITVLVSVFEGSLEVFIDAFLCIYLSTHTSHTTIMVRLLRLAGLAAGALLQTAAALEVNFADQSMWSRDGGLIFGVQTNAPVLS